MNYRISKHIILLAETSCDPMNSSVNKPKSLVYLSGIIKRATQALNYQFQTKRGSMDYYMLGVKTDDGKRLLITLNTREMGWSGELHFSKIYYYRAASNRIIKTTMRNPEKYIGTKVKILGELHPINIKEKKYKVSPLSEFILYLD
jgi:hypothetical protein